MRSSPLSMRAPLLASMLWALAAGAASASSVAMFSPQGESLEIRQVVARFATPMVPFGDLRDRTLPFAIVCPEKGKGRWIDGRTWAYDFERSLPGGVRCSFKTRPGLSDLAGAAVEPAEYKFTTGGPAVLESDPWAGQTIAEDQVFILTLNAAADRASIRQNVWFTVEGLPERIEAELVEGKEREALLAALGPYRRPKDPSVILKARRNFPNDKPVTLIWGSGVRTAGGVSGTREHAIAFRTRKDFDVDVRCPRENARADCNPISPVTVGFGSSVAWKHAAAIELVSAGGKVRKPSLRPYQDDDPEALVDSVSFTGPFEEATRYELRLPEGFQDDAGRRLSPARIARLEVKTAAFPPLAKFAARFGILESEADPALPVTLRNVEAELSAMQSTLTVRPDEGWVSMVGAAYEKLAGRAARVPDQDVGRMLFWLQRLAGAQRVRSVFEGQPEQASAKTFKLPKPSPQKEMEVVGIPMRERGLYVVELASPRLGASHLGTELPMFVPAAVLVTDMAVHFKQGRESSLAWVTRLSDAAPVQGARVSTHDCNGKELEHAVTDADGIARLGGFARQAPVTCGERGALPKEPVKDGAGKDFTDEYGDSYSGPLDDTTEGYFVVARTSDDMSFVHSSWDDGIEAWRMLPHAVTWRSHSDLRHSVLDRTLLRPGQTVHMKHFLRAPVMDGFAIPDKDKRPSRLYIAHVGTDQKYEQDLVWDENGTATTEWVIPAGARLGSYTVHFGSMSDEGGWGSWNSTATFRVEQFRVPLMRGSVGLPARPPVARDKVSADISVQYLSGGAAGELPVIVRSQLGPGSIDVPEDLQGFEFAQGPAKVGIERDNEESTYEDGEDPAAANVHQERALVLDAAGSARAEITAIPASEQIRELVAEVEFRDPNGERQTVAARTTLWPAAAVPGIHVERWLGRDSEVEGKVIVLDPRGKPVAGAPVQVDLLHARSFWSRTRLIGGFYGYDGATETRLLGPFCSGTTDGAGLLACKGRPPGDESLQRGGRLILQATTTDNEGRKSVTHASLWVPGRDTSFAVEASDRIELVPEKREYEPGETARLQVRMPFQKATALMVVEREGTGRARVIELSGENPVLELPILGSYAPNIFVSVVVVRGRVGGTEPTALLDLGRPAFRTGLTELRVGRREHRLDVDVRADKSVYRVRESARVDVQVRTASGEAPPAGSEIALAAVDEGLLELERNPTWDLLDAMMGERSYEVQTATAQTQVVGKRHFGRKALPVGGGGGGGSTRELFDTLLLWTARVALDAAGNASVQVPLNDSLTSFRIVAVASGGAGLFGTGSASVRSSQDLMMLSGLPPLVRAGDDFIAELTLRNTTDAAMDVETSGKVERSRLQLSSQSIHLKAGQAAVVEWPVKVPRRKKGKLRYTLTATSSSGAEDRLRVEQSVIAPLPVRVLQSALLHYAQPVAQQVERPRDALEGLGGIQVVAAQSLGGSLWQARQWLERYRYTCLEQKVSIALGLADDEAWQAIVHAFASYQDDDGLLKYFPNLTQGSEVLTAHVLSMSLAAGRKLPEEIHDRMVAGLVRFVEGNVTRQSPLAIVDLPLRKLLVIEALARAGAGKASMLQSITIEPVRWPTSTLLDWWSILLRIKDVPERATRLDGTERLIRSRLDVAGTHIAFRPAERQGLWWLMRPDDLDEVRLLHLLAENELWREDLPAIAQGALGRQIKGAWSTTVANAWGLLAMQKFDALFGTTTLTGTTTASLGRARDKHTWPAQPVPATLSLPWPSPGAEGEQAPEAAGEDEEERERTAARKERGRKQKSRREGDDAVQGEGEIGREDELRIEHAGDGAPWLTITSRAAIALTEPISAGYRVTKTVTRLDVHPSGELRRGDRVRVRLEIEAQTDMTWVVAEDPVPSGASHLAMGLGRGADIGLASGNGRDLGSPAAIERSHESYRGYFDYLPAGKTAIEYTIRLNQSGSFQLPPTRVEALYHPSMFAELPNPTVKVTP